jgi:hypothetical protein
MNASKVDEIPSRLPGKKRRKTTSAISTVQFNKTRARARPVKEAGKIKKASDVIGKNLYFIRLFKHFQLTNLTYRENNSLKRFNI